MIESKLINVQQFFKITQAHGGPRTSDVKYSVKFVNEIRFLTSQIHFVKTVNKSRSLTSQILTFCEVYE